jgi:hypothetical protein
MNSRQASSPGEQSQLQVFVTCRLAPQIDAVMAFRGVVAVPGGKHLCLKRKEEINMCKKSKLVRIAIPSLLVLGLMMIGTIPGYSEGKYETISAGAFGTGTQVGRLVEVTLVIYQFSSPEDR